MRFGHWLIRFAVFSSIAILLFSLMAWVEAVRLPSYANYWEWREGWHVGVRHGGVLNDLVWWDTHVFIAQFPDRGVVPARPTTGPFSGFTVSPYRWPDLSEKSIRILWPLLGSLVMPGLWILHRARQRAEVRGFSVGTHQPALREPIKGRGSLTKSSDRIKYLGDNFACNPSEGEMR